MSEIENAVAEYAAQGTGLVKTYPRGDGFFNALDGVDLSIGRGEFVAMMGASGSGKSTALHVIAGLTRATSGSVKIDGVALDSMSDRALTIFRRRRIGVVFQSYNLIPHLTAEENILFPLRADGRKIDASVRERMAQLCAELDLTRQLRQYPDSLSGGQQQRVALARALNARPSIILADEPTGNLDWSSSQDVCRILSEMNREQGCAILLVTHEPAVAIWASRVVVLQDGKATREWRTSEFADAGELAARYQDLARGGR